MAIVFSDAFTDTAGVTLPTHNAAWVRHPSAGAVDAVITDANRAMSGSGALHINYLNVDPGTANYTVSAVFYVASLAGQNSGIVGRCNASSMNFYTAVLAPGAAAIFRLYKCVAGSYTQLGTNISSGLGVGQSTTVELVMNGNQISMKAGGATILGPYTDTAHTAPGFAGTYWAGTSSPSNTTQLHLDDFAINTIVSSGGSTLRLGAPRGVELIGGLNVGCS